MRHSVTLYVINGSNSARCLCGWESARGLGGLTVEEALEAAQSHRSSLTDEDHWSCALADDLGEFLQEWLKIAGISFDTANVDHDHNSDPSAPIELHVTITNHIEAVSVEVGEIL